MIISLLAKHVRLNIRNLTSHCKIRNFCINTSGKHTKTTRLHVEANFFNRTTARRCFYTKFFRTPTEEMWKVKDGIPDHYRLIYNTKFEKYIILCQIFTMISVAGVGLVCLFEQNLSGSTVNFDEWRKRPGAVDNEILVYLTCFIAMLVVLNVMVGKLPVRIYHNPKGLSYIFVKHKSLPFTKSYLRCKVNEVVKMEEYGILPWRDIRYKIQNGENEEQILLLDYYFKRPADYNIMLGYQKPETDDEERR